MTPPGSTQPLTPAPDAGDALPTGAPRWAGRWARDPLLAGLWLLAGLLALALWDPGWTATRQRHELLIVLDVTQSMLVADMPQPELGPDAPLVSRLSRSRELLARSLAQLPCGTRVGLGLFTEYRSLLLMTPVEVCENYRELKATLRSIDTQMAWSGNSEVAKGLHGALRAAATLSHPPAVVFVTDGHEAPPVNPRYRPRFDGEVGQVNGLLLGVGGDRPLPIPRRDPSGRPIGTWGPGDVLQVDPRSLGRGGSQGGEAMADDAGSVAPMPGATPGREHLSALREDYLRLLARELKLSYQRLQDGEALRAALLDPALAQPVAARVSLRDGASLLALGVWLGLMAWAWRRRHRAGAAKAAYRAPWAARPHR